MAPHNNKTTIYLIQMSSNIWNIGLFKRISNNEAECILCKANGETKYLFKLSDRSVESHNTCTKQNSQGFRKCKRI